MKICILSLRFFPSIGGVENVVYNQARYLSKYYNVEVHTSDLEQHKIYKRLVNYKKQEKRDNFTIIRHKSIPFYLPGFSFPIIPGFFKLIKDKQIDIIIAHSYWYFPVFAAGIIGKIKKIPIILQPHFDNKKGFFNKIYSNIIAKKVFKRCSRTIFVSEYEQELFKKVTNIENKNIIIYNSMDMLETENIKTKNEQIINKPYIIFIGRIDKGKGLDVLIEAANILNKSGKDYRYVIIGKDFGDLKNLKKMIDNYGLNNRFIIKENENRKELLRWLKGAEILVLPSRYEAFGIVLIEANALNVPVIASKNSAMKHIIRDNINGLLFKTNDYNELAEKITIIEDKNIRNKLIENGYKEVVSKYTYSINMEKLKNLIEFLKNSNV